MGLGTINIHAGDFKASNEHQYVRGKFIMKNTGSFFREKIASAEVAKLEEASEESVISVGGLAGWGLAGSVLLGPAGLLAGLLLGGKSSDTTFICEFKDGRKFLGTASSKVFGNIKRQFVSLEF